ncbi:phosphatase PAP2 family protein [bacterium]|nr:phosphatase PAP2 family protein [bacterium]
MKFMIIFLIIPALAFSQVDDTNSKAVNFSTLFYDMDRHFVGSFTHNYGFNHALAITSTYGIIQSGFDWEYYQFMREHKGIAYAGFPSVIVGGLVPLTIPLGLYFYGKSRDDDELRLTAMALGQAAIMGLGISSIYKAFTVRKPPEVLEENDELEDYSDDFKFGFLNRGVFDGWPSGHTTTAFAMAVTLAELYPDNNAVKISAYLYAFFVGLGISTNIHWFSDFTTGALIGYSIGKIVGEGFRNYKNKEENKNYNMMLTPAGINLII